MCQSLSGGVQGLPQGTQIKASVKERETISITVEQTERETDTKTKRKRIEEGKRKKETETHPERNNVKWTKCVIVTVGKRLLMSCQTSDCAVNLSVNL